MTPEELRIREDREREEYVEDMMLQVPHGPGRRFIRTAINAAWINGRNQIMGRDKHKVVKGLAEEVQKLQRQLADKKAEVQRVRRSLRLALEKKRVPAASSDGDTVTSSDQ